jgi:hypothetical protein
LSDFRIKEDPDRFDERDTSVPLRVIGSGRCNRITPVRQAWSRSELKPDDPRHGTTNGYGNLHCRCDRCREAKRIMHAEYMKRVRAEGRIVGKLGTNAAYTRGCRCDLCRDAHNRKSREYDSKRRRRGN